MAFDPEEADIGLLALVAGWSLADELQRRIAADGYGDLRFADGLVFQHLVEQPQPIGALAERLDVTQQAVSKTVADLTRRGYVERAPHADRRRHEVVLSERGRGAVEASRRHRAAIEREIEARLGPRRVAAARRVLRELVGEREPALRGRRLLPPK